MLGYKIYLIEPVKVPRIANNYKKTDKEDWSQPADIFRNGGMREIYISSEYGEYYILGKAHELLTSYGTIIKGTYIFGNRKLR